MLQCEMDEFVRVGGQWAVVVRLEREPVTYTRCDILYLYPAVRADRVFPYGIGELGRFYCDDARGSRGGDDRVEPGRGRYYDSGVLGVENKISTSQKDLSGSRHDCGRHFNGARGLERGDWGFAGVEIAP